MKYLIMASEALANPTCQPDVCCSISFNEIVNFIHQRCVSISTIAQAPSTLFGVSCDMQICSQCDCNPNGEESRRVLDGLMTIFLTCLALVHQILGEQDEAHTLQLERIQLQKVRRSKTLSITWFNDELALIWDAPRHALFYFYCRFARLSMWM